MRERNLHTHLYLPLALVGARRPCGAPSQPLGHHKRPLVPCAGRFRQEPRLENDAFFNAFGSFGVN